MKRLYLLIGAVVLVSVAAAIFYRNLVLREQAMREPPLSSLRPARNTIIVTDQKPMTDVQIDLLTLMEPAFAALHDDEAGPGRILGYTKLLPPGSAENLRISASARLDPGYYYVVLHGDDGDGIFEINQDMPLRDAKDNPIMARFLVAEESLPARP